jgi:hypothetical protein
LIGRGCYRCGIGIIRLDASFIYSRPIPEFLSNAERIDACCPPPCLFVADPMHCTVVHAAERDRELVARLPSERSWLRITQMVRVRRLPTADKASLPGDIAKVILVPMASAFSSEAYDAKR